MAIAVKVKDIVDELEILFDEFHYYLNRVTGELVTLGPEERSAVEEGDYDPEDYPEWQREVIEKAREVLSSEDYLQLHNGLVPSACLQLKRGQETVRAMSSNIYPPTSEVHAPCSEVS